MSSNTNDIPLPYGWIQGVDSDNNVPFWVDTKAQPPRLIWTHPYQDEQYLNEHPNAHDKALHIMSPPPSYSSGSYNGFSDGSSDEGGSRDSQTKKRGVLGKLKDKAVGTKEEREESKRQFEALKEQYRQQHQQHLLAVRQQRQQYGHQLYGGYPGDLGRFFGGIGYL